LSFALLQGPHYALSTFSGSAIIKLLLKMSNYFGKLFFSNVNIQSKLQKHKKNKNKNLMETQELLAACQFTIVEQVFHFCKKKKKKKEKRKFI